MQALKSRCISEEKFLDDFFASLTPGIIPAAEFIDWDRIAREVKTRSSVIEYLSGLSLEGIEDEIRDTLLATDDPTTYISGFLELLGHTADELAVREAYLSVENSGQRIGKGDEEAATEVARLLILLGMPRLLKREVKDVLLGVKIGLETHRRKNVGGRLFVKEVQGKLTRACKSLSRELHREVSLKPEITLLDSRRNRKRVDFAVYVESQPRVGVEVNFYTVSGSKPTEIRRSYADVRRWLNAAGYEMAWITDGKGYYQMRSSLADAFRIFPNIYTLKQIDTHLCRDLAALLK